MDYQNFKFYEKKDYISKYKSVKSILIQGNDDWSGIDLAVTIPTYKRPGTLKEAIESVLHQKTNVKFKIIVVDNNPDRNDETEEFMKSYKNIGDILYYKNIENVGMSGNWNKCILLAKVDWVILLHDDDLLATNAIKELSKCRFNSFDVVGIQLQTFNDGDPLPDIKNPEQLQLKKITIDDNIHFPALAPSGNLYKRDSIIKVGGFPNVIAPDLILIQLSYWGNVFRINKVLGYYRKGINESTKLSAMEEMCKLNHYCRIQTFKKIGIPKWYIHHIILYSDILFENAFRKEWNDNFRFSMIPQYNVLQYFISKILYKTMSIGIRIKRKIKRRKIIIDK